MKKLLPTTLAILTFFFVSLCHCVTASAADISLVVSPPRLDISGKPGEVVQKTVKVTNNSTDKELILDAMVIDFIVNDDVGTPVKVTESASGRFLASPWFTLDSNEITIKPRETAQIVAIITIPRDALPGGHYAGIFFEPKTEKGARNTVSYTTTQVGSLFGITVAGDIKYDAIIKDFLANSYISEFGPIDFSAVIENQSDTHISPESSIIIKDMFGRTLDTLKLDTLNIFPFASRTISTKWNQIWGLGRYHATLNVVYGDSAVVSRNLYFWILPYRLIIATLVIFLVLVASIISIRRHLLHRSDTRDVEIDELKRKIAEMENEHR